MVAVVQLQFHKTSFATMAEGYFSPKLCVSLFFHDFCLAAVSFLVLNTFFSVSLPGYVSTSLSASPPNLFCWSENGSGKLSSESMSMGYDVPSTALVDLLPWADLLGRVWCLVWRPWVLKVWCLWLPLIPLSPSW